LPKLREETRFLTSTINLNLAISVVQSCIVGWVEVTKPFGYAQGDAQQTTKLVLGGPCPSRSTQPKIAYNTSHRQDACATIN